MVKVLTIVQETPGRVSSEVLGKMLGIHTICQENGQCVQKEQWTERKLAYSIPCDFCS